MSYSKHSRVTNQEKPLLAYFGHHKAGTTWILRIINAICLEINMKHKHFHSPKMFNFNLIKFVTEKNLDFISYTNADINYIRPILHNTKGFHVVRDPRDVVISAYFSHLHSHPNTMWPELADYRKRLSGISKDKGLLLLMDYIKNVKLDGVELDLLGNMKTWDYSLPNILELKFEELISNPYGKFIEILRFLDILDETNNKSKNIIVFFLKKILSRFAYISHIPLKVKPASHKILPWRALSIVYEHDFIWISKGRTPGQEDVKSHFRKGTPGDWKNHFKEKHKEKFKNNFNDLLIKLGYEFDDNW